MPRVALLVVVALAVAATARADTVPAAPLAVAVGLGARHVWLHTDDAAPHAQEQTLLAGVATIALRLTPHVALGFHAGGARSSGDDRFEGTIRYDAHAWSVLALDLALTAQYQLERLTLSPWLGRHVSRRHREDSACVYLQPPGPPTCVNQRETAWTSDFLSYGLTASVSFTPASPVVLFVDIQGGTGGAVLGPASTPRYDYIAVTAGLAYTR
jgi:hypothetical protein